MEEPRRLGDRYELGAELGRGGMAEVHIGHDIRLGRSVAVKTLRADLARDPTFQARFRREAQSAASLNHPAIVAVYDTGEDYVDGVSLPYIVMEYVDGSTLRDLLHSGRRLLPERALEMVSGILSGLEYSHRNGIVHRDIKPANVMLTRNGSVKVMDFGIARAMADTGGITMTQTSSVIGTAQYLSPEQARGETVDARSDLYSTGCLLFELLTLRPPFVGDTPVSVAYQHVREEPQSPSVFDPEVTPAMDAIVLRALAKNADDRYQTADEFRADIERCLDGLPVEAPMGGGAYETAPTAQMGGYGPGAATAMMPAGGDGGGTAMMPPVEDGGGYEEGGRASRRQQQRKKKSHTSTVLLVIAAILVIVGAYLVGKFFLSGDGGGGDEAFKVPSLVGQSLSDARKSTQNVEMKLRRGDPVYCSSSKGTVCKQSPKAGTEGHKGDLLTVYLSKGAKPAEIPDVKGKKYDEAVQMLTGKGFQAANIVKKPQTDDGSDPGTVLDVDPGVGSSAQRNARITLTVAQAPSTKSVPDVSNMSQSDADKAIRDAGFIPVFTVAHDFDDSKLENSVVSQDPGANAQAKPGSKVQVTLNPKQPSSPPGDDQGDGGDDQNQGDDSGDQNQGQDQGQGQDQDQGYKPGKGGQVFSDWAKEWQKKHHH